MTIFSPAIVPTIYGRGEEGYGDEIQKKEYRDWNLVMDEVAGAKRVLEYGGDMVMYHNYVGSVYISDDHAHVADSMYRSHPLLFVQEHVAAALMHCRREGVVEGVTCTDEACVYEDDV